MSSVSAQGKTQVTKALVKKLARCARVSKRDRVQTVSNERMMIMMSISVVHGSVDLNILCAMSIYVSSTTDRSSSRRAVQDVFSTR